MNENSMKDKEAKVSANNKEWNLEISDEQYEEAKAKGFDEETLFKPGKHTFRRRDPGKILKRENKTVVLHLDEETFNFYKRLSEKENGKSIEEEINIKLKSLTEKEAA
ncbi:hypothetical protein BH20ACI4_BH20ACI4_05210 [soil metagenome]